MCYAQFTSVIAGRAIKSEYLSIGTLLATAGIAAVSLSGGSKKESAPSGGAATVSAAKGQEKFGTRCVTPSLSFPPLRMR
jgi:ATP synthase subunit K